MRNFMKYCFQNITGYIYFVQMDRIGPIKIGYSTKPEKRLFSLQTASPYPLNLLCLFPGNEEMENELHECYKEMRLEGEWFLPHPFILKEIETMKKDNEREGFIKPHPEKDLGDWTIGGQKWKDLEVSAKPLFQMYDLAEAFCNVCGNWQNIIKIWLDDKHLKDL